MIERFRRWAIMASLLVFAAALAAYLWVGVGGGDGGKGSYQALDFSNLSHGPRDKGWLLCDTAICLSASADQEPTLIDAPLPDVRRHLVSMIDTDSNLRMLNFDIADNQYDISAYQRRQNLNQVYVVRLVEAGPRLTQVYLFSHQPIGEASKLTNIDRGRSFLARLTRPF